MDDNRRIRRAKFWAPLIIPPFSILIYPGPGLYIAFKYVYVFTWNRIRSEKIFFVEDHVYFYFSLFVDFLILGALIYALIWTLARKEQKPEGNASAALVPFTDPPAKRRMTE